MICPYCNKEMKRGLIEQNDHFGLRWIPDKAQMGPLRSTKEDIKLTSLWKGGALKTHYCPDCRKFVIDQDEIKA